MVRILIVCWFFAMACVRDDARRVIASDVRIGVSDTTIAGGVLGAATGSLNEICFSLPEGFSQGRRFDAWSTSTGQVVHPVEARFEFEGGRIVHLNERSSRVTGSKRYLCLNARSPLPVDGKVVKIVAKSNAEFVSAEVLWLSYDK